MLHQFCPVVAKEFGVNIAIFLHNMAFWTETNLANEKHLYDGHCWTYNTLKAFQKIFPYFSKQNLETIINSCLRQGLIIKGNYNKTKYDRTAWYALTPKAYIYFKQLVNEEYINLLGEAFKAISCFQEIDLPESRNGNPETKKPIPDNKPDNKTYISESDDSPLVCPEGLVRVYIEELPLLSHPRDPKKLNKELLKTLNALIKRWSIDISDKGNSLTYDIFRVIIKKLKEIDYWMFRPEKDAGIKVFCRITNMQQAVEKIIAHEKQGKR